MPVAIDPFFLEASIGQRFCALYRPDVGSDRVRGVVVYVHPFAEELNRTRRMAALQARALAEAGFAVLQIDLHGCGDSSGDFGEATWDSWIDDVELACAWMKAHFDAPLCLWGLRVGCLLGAAVASQCQQPAHLLFWQPVLSGRQFLQQFLRLKLAGDMLGGNNGEGVESLQQRLAAGEALEIAGYILSPGLAAGLERAEMVVPAQASRIECLEISARDEASISPALAMRVVEWQADGHRIHAAVVPGPAFWQTTEISECPALIPATLAALVEHSL